MLTVFVSIQLSSVYTIDDWYTGVHNKASAIYRASIGASSSLPRDNLIANRRGVVAGESINAATHEKDVSRYLFFHLFAFPFWFSFKRYALCKAGMTGNTYGEHPWCEECTHCRRIGNDYDETLISIGHSTIDTRYANSITYFLIKGIPRGHTEDTRTIWFGWRMTKCPARNI